MKKLLMGSVALTLFSISIIIFQMSCKKEATAQTGGTNYTLPAATTSTLGGVIVGNGLSITSNGTLSTNGTNGVQQLGKVVYMRFFENAGASLPEGIFTANYDGSAQTKINIILPANTEFSEDITPKLSPDGLKVFFGVQSTISGQVGTDLYSANINGTNVTNIIDNGVNGKYVILGGAY